MGLNPYCYGIPSQSLEAAKAAGKTSVNDVLILIVMEYLLRDNIIGLCRVPESKS